MFEHHEEHMFNPSPHSPHMKIIKYIGNDKTVLDVGCSTGYIARELKKKGCHVVGIEIDEVAAEMARNYCGKVIVGDIEEVKELPYPDGYFDVIILSDVLEHLKRPDVVLLKLKRYLKPGGFVIASIPNIARLEYRLKLLFGKFDYEDYEKSGILSSAHLRFFTRKTARKLFETSGYKIIKVDTTGLGSKLKFWQTWLAFQFIIIGVPTNISEIKLQRSKGRR